MDWFGFGRKTNCPQPQTLLQQQRSKQIETLKQLNRSVREIRRDSEYRLTIPCANGLHITLQLVLPANFPQDKPRVTVSPAVLHAWVDPVSLQVTGSPAFNSFTVHSDLSRAVREVVDEFQTRPPQPVSVPPAVPPHAAQTDEHRATPPPVPPHAAGSGGLPLNGFADHLTNPPYPTMASTAMGTTLVASSQHPAPRSPAHLPVGAAVSAHPSVNHPMGFLSENHFAVAMTGPHHSPSPPPSSSSSSTPPPPGLLPSVPSVIPSLRDKPIEELQELSNNEGSLYAAIMELPDIKCLETNRIKILQQTEDLAKANLERRPQLDELVSRLKSKHRELLELKSKVDDKLSLQTEKIHERSPANLQDKLKIAVMEADEESEAIANEFLEGDLPLDRFLKDYKSKRKASYMRKTQEEKLGQMVYAGKV